MVGEAEGRKLGAADGLLEVGEFVRFGALVREGDVVGPLVGSLDGRSVGT